MTRASLIATGLKSLVFIVVTTLATVVLASTIRNVGQGGGGASYVAWFTDATSLEAGDDVRMAGVRIGQVDSIEVGDRRLAKVGFSINDRIRIAEGTDVALRFRNLVGQRYLSLTQPEDPTTPVLPPGSTFTVDSTEPALNLTMLFNGFQPLFRLLSPEDVNELSYQIIRVFQGEGATVDQLLSQTASLSRTVADKDEVIGSVIDNLNDVLVTVNARSGEFSQLLVTLRQLVSGLAEDRETIGSALDGIGALTVSVADLTERGRAPLKESLDALGEVSATLADDRPALEGFLQNLPDKLDAVGRSASYGSWVNVYLCEITGEIPVPEGYRGDVGAVPLAQRCGGAS